MQKCSEGVKIMSLMCMRDLGREELLNTCRMKKGIESKWKKRWELGEAANKYSDGGKMLGRIEKP